MESDDLIIHHHHPDAKQDHCWVSKLLWLQSDHLSKYHCDRWNCIQRHLVIFFSTTPSQPYQLKFIFAAYIDSEWNIPTLSQHWVGNWLSIVPYSNHSYVFVKLTVHYKGHLFFLRGFSSISCESLWDNLMSKFKLIQRLWSNWECCQSEVAFQSKTSGPNNHWQESLKFCTHNS